jgi:hypothetical protein
MRGDAAEPLATWFLPCAGGGAGADGRIRGAGGGPGGEWSFWKGDTGSQKGGGVGSRLLGDGPDAPRARAAWRQQSLASRAWRGISTDTSGAGRGVVFS